MVRRARPDDAHALATLAALDSAEPLLGEVLLAEVGDELWAARSLADGRAISDPFRPAAPLRAMLEMRARQLGADDGRRSRRLSRLLGGSPYPAW